MAATLWDHFEHLLDDAEKKFLEFQFTEAVELWQKYYAITAKVEYEKFIKEIVQLWDEERFSAIPSLTQLYRLFCELREKRQKKQISSFTFELYKRLLVNIYRERFRYMAQNEVSLEAGVFEYLSGAFESAVEKLQQVVEENQEELVARIFLGHTYMALKDSKQAIAILSQNLFLAADELQEEDLYLSQFKMLLGRLHTTTGSAREAMWLLTFESWYRNYLIIKEDLPFFRVIQQKETSERILQVKYYAYERYRHFVRSLFIAEYLRLYDKDNRGMLLEQVTNMARLDAALFERYRKKRKTPVNKEPKEGTS